MKKISSNIHNFFCNPVPVQTLGCFRIAVGIFALAQLLILLPDWMWFYGPKGLLPWEISDALSTRQTPGLAYLSKLLLPLNISDNGTVYLVTGVYFSSLVGLIAGYKTRLMGTLAWLMHLILNTTGHFTAYGVETFAHIALFYCMILPVGTSWSVDSYKKPSTLPPYLITLSVRIIQLHFCIMYLASGLEKSMGSQWWNGEAIWIAMQQDQFHKVDINWMAGVPIVPKMLCIGTLITETLYPLGMLWRKTKKMWFIAILSMHLFIGVFLGLQLFGGLMFLLNLTAFGEYCFPGIFTRRIKNFSFDRFSIIKQTLLVNNMYNKGNMSRSDYRKLIKRSDNFFKNSYGYGYDYVYGNKEAHGNKEVGKIKDPLYID
jgi:hypothetical protein